MKYFIHTHDKNKGSFPHKQLTEQEFFANFDSLEEAAEQFSAFGHAAHVNLQDCKAFCFMSGPDEEVDTQGTRGDRFSLRSRGETRDRCRYANCSTAGRIAAQGRVATRSFSNGAQSNRIGAYLVRRFAKC